jgi:hypothetical protein
MRIEMRKAVGSNASQGEDLDEDLSKSPPAQREALKPRLRMGVSSIRAEMGRLLC